MSISIRGSQDNCNCHCNLDCHCKTNMNCNRNCNRNFPIVLCQVIPAIFEHRVEKVFLRSDGAGCYNSKLQRACQVLWGCAEGWGDEVTEESSRISISGAGKTDLDSLYGIAGAKLKRACKNGV